MARHTDNEKHPMAKGLTIEPPPQETSPEPLYRVVYMIDINANDPRQAAERAHALMQDGQSMPPVLDILDSTGRCTQVDLSEP
jgi:hypothetical protein